MFPLLLSGLGLGSLFFKSFGGTPATASGEDVKLRTMKV